LAAPESGAGGSPSAVLRTPAFSAVVATRSVGRRAAEDVTQRGQDLQRQPLRDAGDQAVDLGSRQIDAPVTQQRHQLSSGEDPVPGHHLAQPPCIADLAFHASLPAWVWSAVSLTPEN